MQSVFAAASARVISGYNDFNDRQGLAVDDCGREGQTVKRCDSPIRRYDFAGERASRRDVPARRGSVCGNGQSQSTLCLTLFLPDGHILTNRVPVSTMIDGG